jgi:PadR family transcriptional regulator, regulatory protein PadR
MEDRATTGASPPLRRFDLAPPRRFLFPAVLLLLADEPGYGYRLVKELKGFGFGAADRPSVYRTLGQLERDGLVVSWSDAESSAQSRRLYRMTLAGEQTLRVWMGVIKQERDRLDAVMRRYAASGGFDAALADVEGGWGAGPAVPLSVIHPAVDAATRPPSMPARDVADPPAGVSSESYRGRFEVVSARSAVMVDARSSVGPLTFGAMGLAGTIETPVQEGRVVADETTTANVVVPAGALRSGNEIYDAELRRRIDARHFPEVTLALRDCRPGGAPDHLRVTSDVTIHGVTRRLEGTLAISQPGAGVVSAMGEQVVDIRDFDIASPTLLMLRIYPDVVVKLYVEAEEVDLGSDR